MSIVACHIYTSLSLGMAVLQVFAKRYQVAALFWIAAAGFQVAAALYERNR